MSILRDILGNLKQAIDQREILIQQGFRAEKQRARIIELLEHGHDVAGFTAKVTKPINQDEE